VECIDRDRTSWEAAWRRQDRPSGLWILAVYVPLGILLIWAKWWAPVAGSDLVAPISVVPRQSAYDGALWMVGLAAWGCASGAALIGYFRVSEAPWSSRRRLFLLTGAALGLVFLVDDLWQLHQPVFPDAVGVPSLVVLAAYAVLFAVWVFSFRSEISATGAVVLLGIALASFALWIACKSGPPFEARTSIESGAKLAGAFGWASYLCYVSLRRGGSLSGSE
jgi:hypothetical protein